MMEPCCMIYAKRYNSLMDQSINGPESKNFTCKNHIILSFEKHLGQFKDRLSDKPRRVLIINTGGTISMVNSDRGLITKQGSLQECMRKNPYLCDIDYTYFQAPPGFLITPQTMYHRRILYQVYEFPQLIDSANIETSHWFQLAHFIKKEYANYDAFVVLHGTDTMAYTASALSFMFENLQKPIVLTGSQVPISFARNDGFQNILNALMVAGHFQIPEVMVAFYDKLLRGNRTQKVSSMNLDSFDSPKFRPLGRFLVNVEIDWDLISRIKHQDQEEELIVAKNMCKEVSSIRLTPLTTEDTFREVFDNQHIRGIIIETYGAGNWKTDQGLLKIVRNSTERGVIVVSISQCFNSKVQMLYETGIMYENIGVVSGGDLTMEAAMAKLAYLLGKGLSHQEVREKMQRNLRGELTPQNLESQFDLEGEPFMQEFSNAIADGSGEGLHSDLIMPNILCLMSKHNMKTPFTSFANINVQAVDYDNRTVLHIAAREGALEIAQWILQQGGVNVINEQDRFNHSALFEAVKYRHQQMIALLVSNGAQLIAPLREITSMLMKAVVDDDVQLFELFVAGGVKDFTLYKTIDDRTVAHLAQSIENQNVLNFLRQPEVLFDWNSKDRWGNVVVIEGGKID